MRFLGWILKPINPDFMTSYWTTIGETIYYPTSVNIPEWHTGIIEHEKVHIAQWRVYGLWFWFSYLFLPIPFGLAWWRYAWEREAYLVDIAARRMTIQEVARILSSSKYGWAWPRPWIEKWLRKQVGMMDR